MINIKNIAIDSCQNRLNINIIQDGISKNVFIETNSPNEQYFVTDRCDGIVVGLLNYAMRNNHNIKCELPITIDLYFNLTTILIPNLCKSNKDLHEIKIEADLISVPLHGFAVGTGISRGVDSLYTLLTAQKYELQQFHVTHLLLNNVGQHGESDRAKKLYQDRICKSRAFANEYGFKLVECNTNLQELFPQDHFKSHTYTNLFPVITLGKLFKIYYYASSGIGYNEISLGDADPSVYEPILLPALSNSGVTFYSGGVNVSRMEKLQELINYEPSYNYLDVCFFEGENCGRCEKCIRTISALYGLNALDKYGSVFNLSDFNTNKNWYMTQIYYYYKKKHHDYKAIYKLTRSEIGLNNKIKAYGRIIFDRLITLLYPIKEKFFPNYHYHK